MYVMDYLIYHLKPYGILRTSDSLPNKLGVGEFLPPPNEALGTAASNEDSVDDEDRFVKTLTNSTRTPNDDGEMTERGAE